MEQARRRVGEPRPALHALSHHCSLWRRAPPCHRYVLASGEKAFSSSLVSFQRHRPPRPLTQVSTICKVLEILFPKFGQQIVIRGDDKTWSYAGKGNREGKQVRFSQSPPSCPHFGFSLLLSTGSHRLGGGGAHLPMLCSHFATEHPSHRRRRAKRGACPAEWGQCRAVHTNRPRQRP